MQSIPVCIYHDRRRSNDPCPWPSLYGLLPVHMFWDPAPLINAKT